MTDIRECLPEYVVKVMQQSVLGISKQIDGFNRKDAVLTAAETRSSSPLRITRNSLLQSPSLKGLYPAGEGAGYAGGILSAAVDGLRTAKRVIISRSQLVEIGGGFRIPDILLASGAVLHEIGTTNKGRK